jgi:spermidine synthase
VGLSLSLGANTLGAAAAPRGGLGPGAAAGQPGALLAVAAGYLLLIAPRGWLRPGVAGAAVAAAAAAAVLAPPLAFIDMPEGGRVLSYREGALAAVSVVADADGVARLRINNRQQEGSSATLLADARQALLPLLLHPAPRRALFLGLGTGVTATAAAADPALQVDAAELLPEVIDASALFRTAAPRQPTRGCACSQPTRAAS